ncbi:MAG: hypothetical protein CMK59_01590 [Proteobacteria bacterium]|nr:hypothetical protein [Pseudomonadota bacterium]
MACLERVTGEPVPLDERFYIVAEKAHGDPNKGDGRSDPFASFDGDMIVLSGTVVSENKTSGVDIDFRIPDPTAPGGMKGQGKLLLEQPGSFSLNIPKSLGELEIQAFQDLNADGPSGEDPFSQINLTVGEEPISEITIDLKVGSRTGSGPIHQEIPHVEKSGPDDALPGDPNSPSPDGNAPPKDEDPFSNVQGQRIVLSGELICNDCEDVDLDIFAPDQSQPGGRLFLGKIKKQGGAYELSIPADFGPIIIEAFIDSNNDGPGPGDWMGSYVDNPIQVGQANIDFVDIELKIPKDGKMPRGQPQAPPPQSPPP